MTRRDDRISMRQMLDHANEARQLASGRTRAELDTDRVFALALTRLLEIVGEAAARVSHDHAEPISEHCLVWHRGSSQPAHSTATTRSISTSCGRSSKAIYRQ